MKKAKRKLTLIKKIRKPLPPPAKTFRDKKREQVREKARENFPGFGEGGYYDGVKWRYEEMPARQMPKRKPKRQALELVPLAGNVSREILVLT